MIPLPLLAALLVVPANLSTLTIHEIVPVPDYSTTTLRAYATTVAESRGLNADRFVDVLDCESGFEHDAKGDGGQSFGVAQFHKPVRDWGVSVEYVLNPYNAIDLMARAWLDGKAPRWSCWWLVQGLSPYAHAS